MQKNVYSKNSEESENGSVRTIKLESPSNVGNNCEPSDEAFAAVVDELIKDVILDFCFQLHPVYKIGLFKVDDEDLVPLEPEDIFGQVKGKFKLPKIDCIDCGRKIEPTRFANHLEKCKKNNGRQSGRNASKKAPVDYGEGESDLEEDDDDENESDVSYNLSGRKRQRKKNSKTVTRKKPKDSISENFESLSHEEFKQFLDQYCAVISRHTKRRCMNTQNCSQHTSDQKKEVRELYKNHISKIQNQPKTEDVHIDDDIVDSEFCEYNIHQNISGNSTPDLPNEHSE